MFITKSKHFIHLRYDWDQYLATGPTDGGSRIPRGWVKPPQPSSELWSQYLQPFDLESQS